ncbi:hypothetical protein BDK51DRAFT_27809 [Blyttiomyces helicus]|uniref:Uncharacterized protein n=1 Tax=Blyttiomyces helicus TaxID=388810 RepID=A0A4P9W0T4_9FUNG|nr:hypothetical protein BDK51DRAFT_27809 [Blyttiomyces helicus]|eukprot:RKO84733.1 hypothetical protein BDK51DRAFT_27809 [Blyttiomyces helicus]
MQQATMKAAAPKVSKSKPQREVQPSPDKILAKTSPPGDSHERAWEASTHKRRGEAARGRIARVDLRERFRRKVKRSLNSRKVKEAGAPVEQQTLQVKPEQIHLLKARDQIQKKRRKEVKLELSLVFLVWESELERQVGFPMAEEWLMFACERFAAKAMPPAAFLYPLITLAHRQANGATPAQPPSQPQHPSQDAWEAFVLKANFDTSIIFKDTTAPIPLSDIYWLKGYVDSPDLLPESLSCRKACGRPQEAGYHNGGEGATAVRALCVCREGVGGSHT